MNRGSEGFMTSTQVLETLRHQYRLWRLCDISTGSGDFAAWVDWFQPPPNTHNCKGVAYIIGWFSVHIHIDSRIIYKAGYRGPHGCNTYTSGVGEVRVQEKSPTGHLIVRSVGVGVCIVGVIVCGFECFCVPSGDSVGCEWCVYVCWFVVFSMGICIYGLLCDWCVVWFLMCDVVGVVFGSWCGY